jgi:hypothetical protein
VEQGNVSTVVLAARRGVLTRKARVALEPIVEPAHPPRFIPQWPMAATGLASPKADGREKSASDKPAWDLSSIVSNCDQNRLLAKHPFRSTSDVPHRPPCAGHCRDGASVRTVDLMILICILISIYGAYRVSPHQINAVKTASPSQSQTRRPAQAECHQPSDRSP